MISFSISPGWIRHEVEHTSPREVSLDVTWDIAVAAVSTGTATASGLASVSCGGQLGPRSLLRTVPSPTPAHVWRRRSCGHGDHMVPRLPLRQPHAESAARSSYAEIRRGPTWAGMTSHRRPGEGDATVGAPVWCPPPFAATATVAAGVGDNHARLASPLRTEARRLCDTPRDCVGHSTDSGVAAVAAAVGDGRGCPRFARPLLPFPMRRWSSRDPTGTASSVVSTPRSPRRRPSHVRAAATVASACGSAIAGSITADTPPVPPLPICL